MGNNDTNTLNVTYTPATTGSTFPTYPLYPVGTFQNVTVTVSDEQADPAGVSPMWEGVLGVEGLATDDGRYLMPGQISERDLPLTLMAQTVTAEGHQGAEIAGKITEVWREPREDLGPNAVAIMGRGQFDAGEFGQETARMVEDETLRGVSLDMAITSMTLLDPETLEPVNTDEMDLMEMLMGEFLTGVGGDVMGATLTPFPAFADATVKFLGGGLGAIVASAYGMKITREVLTASAAGSAPLKPPKAWFELPEANIPTPLTVDEDGKVYGHLALWGQCHTGFASCETPPRSFTDYSYFHLGEIETAEGDTIAVGRITVGDKGKAKGGHASIIHGAQGAMEHYDNAGCGAAFVRASNGNLGIWLSGAVRSDVPAERIRDLRAYPPSGDWRRENGGMELVAVLSVPVPGFPIPRSEARIAASGGVEEIEALVATGYVPADAFRSRKRKKKMLGERVYAIFGDSSEPATKEDLRHSALAFSDGFAISAAERKKAARSGESLPDGSFPIRNCAEAEKAIHAQGRANDQAKVVAHIKKRVRALDCSGSIFEKYR